MVTLDPRTEQHLRVLREMLEEDCAAEIIYQQQQADEEAARGNEYCRQFHQDAVEELKAMARSWQSRKSAG